MSAKTFASVVAFTFTDANTSTRKLTRRAAMRRDFMRVLKLDAKRFTVVFYDQEHDEEIFAEIMSMHNEYVCVATYRMQISSDDDEYYFHRIKSESERAAHEEKTKRIRTVKVVFVVDSDELHDSYEDAHVALYAFAENVSDEECITSAKRSELADAREMMNVKTTADEDEAQEHVNALRIEVLRVKVRRLKVRRA